VFFYPILKSKISDHINFTFKPPDWVKLTVGVENAGSASAMLFSRLQDFLKQNLKSQFFFKTKPTLSTLRSTVFVHVCSIRNLVRSNVNNSLRVRRTFFDRKVAPHAGGGLPLACDTMS
jgi:hypothetical protein